MSSPYHKWQITCLVSNDLAYDQRMQRVCTAFREAGHEVTLLGRLKLPASVLSDQPYQQVRLKLPLQNGFIFYAALNIRFFFYLMFHRADIIYAVDMDTLPAGLLAAVLTGRKCVYDAHEYYSESPELVNRRVVRKFWRVLEKWLIPHTDNCITVSPVLAQRMSAVFGKPFHTIRNLPMYYDLPPKGADTLFILYQGVLNVGRGLEEMIQAMHHISIPLYIAGEGDISEELRRQVNLSGLGDKVKFLGWLSPRDLKELTAKAWLGVNLLKPMGMSYRMSLANKFFDYIMAGSPVLCTPFEAYIQADGEFHVAQWVESLTPDMIVSQVNDLLDNPAKYMALKDNCLAARKHWNWDNEKQKLIAILDQYVR